LRELSAALDSLWKEGARWIGYVATYMIPVLILIVNSALARFGLAIEWGSNFTAPQVVAVLGFLWLSLGFLIFAPYVVWREKSKEIAELLLSSQPRLTVRSGERFVKSVRSSQTSAKSLRAEVSCVGTAVRNCKVYLAAYEKWQPDGWEQLNIARVQLKWADDPKREAQDIHPAAPAQAVFANTFEGSPQLIIAGGTSPPRLDPGRYRLTIVAAGDNPPEAVCRVEVEWDGNWQTVQPRMVA
jgi:hypothetical protein